ncbi:hypothetical protein CMI44_00930 [Candidatus Pacearchaeota archaeon]|nr:hypothetical protein [Candidatus Pacearchaeota archaeon]
MKKKGRMLEFVRRHSYVKIPLGLLCILIGFIGGFIPIFQGWVFVFFGCTILFGYGFIKKIRRFVRRKV